MTSYACQPACAGCRRAGQCEAPRREVSVVRDEDPFSLPPLSCPYITRNTRAAIKGIGLSCGCNIPEILIVLIGTKGQQVYCEKHKQYSRIRPEQISAAKKKAKHAVASGQASFDDIPPY